MSGVCGGVCSAGDGHRDFFADGHVPADDTGGIVRGVVGICCCKKTADFGRAAKAGWQVLTQRKGIARWRSH